MHDSRNAREGQPGEAERRTCCIHPCPVDEQPCQVLLHLPRAAARELPVLASRLPCPWCPRWLLDQVERLPRLGKNERRVLLAAAGPEEPAAVIEPAASGRSAAVANRRAVRLLVCCGLLLAEDDTGGKLIKPAVRLSPLGRAVVARLAEELRKDKPLSLHRHRSMLLSEAREEDRSLLQRLRDRLEVQQGAVRGASQQEASAVLDHLAAAGRFVQDALRAV